MVITYTTVPVADALLGRVTSAAMTLSSGDMPLASLHAGQLLATLGPTASVLVPAAVSLVVALTATAGLPTARATAARSAAGPASRLRRLGFE